MLHFKRGFSSTALLTLSRACTSSEDLGKLQIWEGAGLGLRLHADRLPGDVHAVAGLQTTL